MIIEGNEKEKQAMEAFHRGDRKEGLRLQEEFASAFRRNTGKRITVPARKRAAIMETVKNVWPFTGLIRNMFPTACGRSSIRN